MSETASRFLTAESSVHQLLSQPSTLSFDGTSEEEHRSWRKTFRRTLIKNLGPKPEPVPQEVEILEHTKMDGYIREKIIFNPDSFSSIPAYVLIPDKASQRNKCPAVLCSHGHGMGKDPLVGLKEDYQKQFAVELTLNGFITISPDWRCFGERRDRDEWVRRSNRDGCNVAYFAFGYFGYQLLQLNICDAQRCLDYLQSRVDVDKKRIGCMGCSFGGTMTTYVSAIDQRIKAAVIVCYLSTLEEALGDRGRGNACGSQFMFGLKQFGKIADVSGLIAPRPCMVQVASDDTCFIDTDAKKAFSHLKQVYSASGHSSKLELDYFEGEHEVDLAPAISFFKENLQ